MTLSRSWEERRPRTRCPRVHTTPTSEQVLEVGGRALVAKDRRFQVRRKWTSSTASRGFDPGQCGWPRMRHAGWDAGGWGRVVGVPSLDSLQEVQEAVFAACTLVLWDDAGASSLRSSGRSDGATLACGPLDRYSSVRLLAERQRRRASCKEQLREEDQNGDEFRGGAKGHDTLLGVGTNLRTHRRCVERVVPT